MNSKDLEATARQTCFKMFLCSVVVWGEASGWGVSG